MSEQSVRSKKFKNRTSANFDSQELCVEPTRKTYRDQVAAMRKARTSSLRPWVLVGPIETDAMRTVGTSRFETIESMVPVWYPGKRHHKNWVLLVNRRLCLFTMGRFSTFILLALSASCAIGADVPMHKAMPPEMDPIP
jgi:hypothetical protein